MQKELVDLTAALRERLAIIGDENSRRDPAAHTARLSAVLEKIEKLEMVLPKPMALSAKKAGRYMRPMVRS